MIGKTMADEAEKTAKSYHSSDVPVRLATKAFTRELRAFDGAVECGLAGFS